MTEAKRTRQRDHRDAYVFATLALLEAGDVLSTKWALGTHGLHEGNPTAAPYVHLPVALLLLGKVGFAGLAWLAWHLAKRRTVKRTGRPISTAYYLPLCALLGVYAYIITSNVALTLHALHT